MRFNRLGLLASIAFGLGILLAPLYAQEKVPLTTGPLSSADKAQPLEVVTVSVNRFGALPSSITRHPGKFILVVVDKSGGHAQSYSLLTVSAANTQPAATPLMSLGGATARNGKSAGLFNAPVGQFQLKSTATGAVLCQITID